MSNCLQPTRDHAALLVVVLTFLLCHSLRLVHTDMEGMTMYLCRFVAKLYQVIILDEYLEERR